MDPNNSNCRRNFNFPYYPNPQNNSNTPPFDPNIINNPQFQAALQWFGSQPRPMNPTFQQSSENNPSFPFTNILLNKWSIHRVVKVLTMLLRLRN